jgi:DNA-binding PadR family transcriptional regulator
MVSIALAETKPPAWLTDIIFAGDSINKAVFTPQELRRGLSKLTQAGYVNDEGGIYSLTDEGRALVHDRRRREGWMSVRRRIEKRLAATADGDGLHFDDARFPYPAVTDEAVEDAVKQYRAKFARLLAELKKRNP